MELTAGKVAGVCHNALVVVNFVNEGGVGVG
jgi:hypothetical protein